MARRLGSILLFLVALASTAHATPSWKFAGTYDAKNGATAVVYIDVNSIIRTGKFIRVWVMSDFDSHQEGDWHADPGVSRAYMSSRQLLVVDCRTKDVGFGTFTALDGRRGSGSVVHTDSVRIPTSADHPSAPETIGDQVAAEACKRAK